MKYSLNMLTNEDYVYVIQVLSLLIWKAKKQSLRYVT